MNNKTIYMALIGLLACSCGKNELPISATSSYPFAEGDPIDFGLDPALLEKAQRRAEEEYFEYLQVIRYDHIVLEFRESISLNIKKIDIDEIAKGFVAAVVGAALSTGEIEDVDDPVSKYHPGFRGNKSDITIRHLLNMNSGMVWDEEREVVKNRRPYSVGVTSWLNAVKMPLSDPPGTAFNYSSLSTQSLGKLVEEITGIEFTEYARVKLFQPMGIVGGSWAKQYDLDVWVGNDLSIDPYDIARLGKLYLDRGAWQGRQLIEREFVDDTFNHQVKIDSTIGFSHHWWVNHQDEIIYSGGSNGTFLGASAG